MYLPDHEIETAVRTGHLGVTPFDPALVQPASIDVRLDREFMVLHRFRGGDLIDPSTTRTGTWQYVECRPRDHAFVLIPGDFVLASTWEKVRMPADLLGRLEGKSSLGRLGVRVHSTAGFIDPGFEGHITLELSNDAGVPVALWPGQRIGQLSLARLSSPAQRPYGSGATGSRYQGQRGPTQSLAAHNFQRGLPGEVPA